jgi:addiction module RelE/StbE family toxin
MKKPAKREVSFAFADGFQKSFDEFVEPDTPRAERFKDFLDKKSKIPPERLPGTMRDHALIGALSGFKECHLDSDVLLIYTHERDEVMLYRVCDHAAIEVKNSKKMAKLLRKK